MRKRAKFFFGDNHVLDMRFGPCFDQRRWQRNARGGRDGGKSNAV